MNNCVPERSAVWGKKYITYRRLWLDSCLNAYSNEMHGSVIDLGGKRENKRGSFRPLENEADSWLYINLDPKATPNIFADVTQTPLRGESVDCLICTEVLEHLPNPQACVDEAHRLLRKGGVVFASVPFIYPVHADPFDFQRFTEDGFRKLFSGFSSVEIIPMGSFPGVLGMLIEIGIEGIQDGFFFSKLTRRSLRLASRWLCSYDISIASKNNIVWRKFTTGYFTKIVK
jgi:SAM-dependent methyltransferase